MPATFTFDPGLSSDRDYVRSRVGDKDGQPQWFLADQTIDAYLTRFGSVDEACAQAAESIGAMCAQLATQVVVAKVKLQYQERSTQMFSLADRIRNLAQPSAGNPGADFVQIEKPDLSNYGLSLPDGDPNNPAGSAWLPQA